MPHSAIAVILQFKSKLNEMVHGEPLASCIACTLHIWYVIGRYLLYSYQRQERKKLSNIQYNRRIFSDGADFFLKSYGNG